MNIENQENTPEQEPKTDASEPETLNNQPTTEPEADEDADLEIEQAAELLTDAAAEYKDKYLRLYSEFDNYRRRTSKERLELIKTASEDLMQLLLPSLDDLERAEQAFETVSDIDSLKEGIQLVRQKLFKTLQNKGLKVMEADNQAFDPDMHQAITQMPAPSPEMVGKVVLVVEKGYLLGEKPIRFAKVIIGS